MIGPAWAGVSGWDTRRSSAPATFNIFIKVVFLPVFSTPGARADSSSYLWIERYHTYIYITCVLRGYNLPGINYYCNTTEDNTPKRGMKGS